MNKVILSFLFVFLFQGVASADEGERRSENIEKMKSNVLDHIGKKRAVLDTFEGCVKSASAREDIKTCRKSKKEAMKNLRAENKEKKEKFRSERKEKRKQRKGKRGKRDSDKD